MDMTRMGAFLKALRREHGLTQEQLAERLGITNKTISRWETGAYMPPVEMLLALSEMYGVSMNELVTGQRLTQEESLAKAEENLTELIREKALFHLAEQKAYWLNKWKQDHRWTITIAVVLMVIIQILGIVLDKDMLNAGGAILALGLGMYFNNARSSYVEHHLYDDQLEHMRS